MFFSKSPAKFPAEEGRFAFSPTEQFKALLQREDDALFSVAHSFPLAMSKKKVPKKKLASVPLDRRHGVDFVTKAR